MRRLAAPLLALSLVLILGGCAHTVILLDRPDYHYQTGLRFLNEGNMDGARLEFEYAVFLNHDFAPAWVGLAIAYGTLGDLDRAVESMRRAQTLLQPGGEKKNP